MSVTEIQEISAVARDITAIVSLLTMGVGGCVAIKRVIVGIRCLLRAQMLSIYYRNKDTKTIRQYEAENYSKMYSAYKFLHGNSFVDVITKEVKTWEIVT